MMTSVWPTAVDGSSKNWRAIVSLTSATGVDVVTSRVGERAAVLQRDAHRLQVVAVNESPADARRRFARRERAIGSRAHWSSTSSRSSAGAR